MDLTVIKDYFTCCSNIESQRLQKNRLFLRENFKYGIFSLFKQISSVSGAELDFDAMRRYMAGFTSSLQHINPSEIWSSAKVREYPSPKEPTEEETIEKGLRLFMGKWTNGCFNYEYFCRFLQDEHQLPKKAQEVPYIVRKRLFDLFESEIQNLLNLQTVRNICVREYGNLTDLFETLADSESSKITLESVKNLFLMHSERMDEIFYENMLQRIKLPMGWYDFENLFEKRSGSQKKRNPKTMDRKILYSSARKNKHDFDFEDAVCEAPQSAKRELKDIFSTPKGNKIVSNNRNAMTSTKLTKGIRYTEHKDVDSVSQFSVSSERDAKVVPVQILGEILKFEEQFTQAKRELILQKDCDLELIYQRQGHRFQKLLNSMYGLCNFSAFVRFLVPQDFEHKYLAFVRHQKSNRLTATTLELIDDLFEKYERKQSQIGCLWESIDKEMMFRVYCKPGSKAIQSKQFEKYFSKRECGLLLERMDPLKSGKIQFVDFK